MSLRKVLISLGSNVAPKKPTIHRALGEIVVRKLGRILLVSPFYKTKPWGVEDQDWYINGCIMLETELSPHELLEQLQKIENDYGRVREIKWGPRTIDLDILLFEGYENINDDKLTIPHPYMLKRAFVLRPLADMVPWFSIDGRTVLEYLSDLNDNSLERLESLDDTFEEIINMYWHIPPSDIVMGLERVESALTILGNPHLKCPKIIHIAGTNGKGSTAAILHSILGGAGKTVHRYTSPHLRSYNERYIIGIDSQKNRYISSAEFEIAVARITPLIDKLKLTHFEALCLVGFLVFSGHKADYLILETGMGGRLDATNVVPNPAMTIITSISKDHTEFLGDIVESIAFEKAGIIKKNVPVVISARHKDAVRVICEIAENKNSDSYVIKSQWDIKLIDDCETFISTLNEEEVLLDGLSLRGVFQLDNAGAAMMASQILLGDEFPSQEILDEKLESIRWPARLERLNISNAKLALPKDLDLIIDGCHNPDGMICFVEQMLALNVTNPKPLTVFFSCKNGRDLNEVFHIMSKLNAHFIFIKNHFANDQYDANNLALVAAQYDISHEIVENWGILERVMLDKNVKEKRYAVCGSLYFCGSFYNVIDYVMKP